MASLAVHRNQSSGEEIANAISHGSAALLSLVALPVLVVNATSRGLSAAEITGAAVFGVSLILAYLSSMLYHALAPGSAKRIFRVLDHASIYILIAGTYTPFTLGVLSGSWGWSLFAIIWGLACTGIVLKAVGGIRFAAASLILYLLMGWLVLVAVHPMLEHVPRAGLGWLLAGGIAYTCGVPFYALDHRIRYSHFIWHLFVIAGSACHFVAVMYYAA